MAQTIVYTKAQLSKLKAWEWTGVLDDSRVIKMARPQCRICQTGKVDLPPNWADSCTHDPYWSSQKKTRVKPTWEDQVNPDTGETESVLTGEETTTYRVRVPNIVEVSFHARSNAGKGPQLFQVFKGYKRLPEVGLAPMCEMRGCGKAWPTVRTRFGDFCTEQHARAVGADIEGANKVVYATDDVRASTLAEATPRIEI